MSALLQKGEQTYVRCIYIKYKYNLSELSYLKALVRRHKTPEGTFCFASDGDGCNKCGIRRKRQ